VSDLRRRTATAVVYGAAVAVVVLAPAPVLWVALGIVAVVGLVELAGLRVGSATIAYGLLFPAGLASLGALREIGPLGAHHGTADGLPVWLFLAILPTWAGDVAAYLVGSRIGRRRLAPRISPGKTWEGTLAGFGAAALAALGVAALFGLPRLPAAIAVVGLGPVGLAGDLFESHIKRRAGVKDSGTILPGHGGTLDRLDSLVAAAIFTLVVVTAAGGG
jgi:phosphatidate cytidylyltransferase